MRLYGRKFQHILTLSPLCFLIISCAAGPDFKTPTPPPVHTYTNKPLPKRTVSINSLANAGKSQIFQVCERIPGEWWALYRSRTLNQLIDIGLANNPNLKSVLSRLTESQENYKATFGAAFFPGIDGNFLAQRQRFPGASIDFPVSIFNTFGTTADVAYTVDIFGKLRRQVEASKANVDYETYEALASYLTLTNQIVTTAITSASLKAQIKTTNTLIHDQRQLLSIVKQQFQVGAASAENVAAQETLLAQTEATLPPLQKSLAQSQHMLNSLLGQYPNHALPLLNLNEITLPKTIPVSLPSALVRQRPDIMASEALLHVATANVGVATADLLPQVTLTANAGWSAGEISKLFLPANQTWSIATSVAQAIFHGGSLFATRRAKIAAMNSAYYDYQNIVLNAFKEVADTLRALELDANTLQADRKAELAAKKSLLLVKSQYRLGGASFIDLLNAETQYLQTSINRVTAETARYNDTAALFQAVGGGWWNNQAVRYTLKEKGLTLRTLHPIDARQWSQHA